MTQALAPALEPTARARRGPARGRPGWSALVVLLALLTAAPVVAVLAQGGGGVWPSDLGSMVLTTIALMVGVALGTLVVGCGLAWLVTAYTFPLRNLMVWLLVLPLAMPAYILGFVFLATFDAAGPVQQWLRAHVYDGTEVDVSTVIGCAVVMSLTLYPYVYLLARSAFAEQAPTTYDAARMLGAGRVRAFLRVMLPLARPSLAAGLALVMMEVLTDFATVQYFGVQTVSYGVYITWKQQFAFASASQLASLVMLFAVVVMAGERLFRGRARYTQRGGRGSGLAPTPLPLGRGLVATSLCLIALLAAVIVPVLRLAGFAIDHARDGDGRPALGPEFLEALGNSAVVAVLAALLCVTLAVLMGHALRLGAGRVVRAAAQLTTFGYAVPGAVIGIGVLLLLSHVPGVLATGSVAAVLCAYAIRFLGPAFQAVDASYAKLPPSLTQSALSLGAGPLRVFTRVHLPLVRPGILVALVLVIIDAIKELPLVLMLRPVGFDTASAWVHRLATENLWGLAAAPALVIVALAVIPVAILGRRIRAADRREGGRR